MTWWHYLLLVNIYLTLFFGFYALLLRRETFFQLNRVYLVGASLLSFFIPLIQAQWVKALFITQQVQSTIYSAGSTDVIVRFAPLKDNPVTIGELLTLFYAGGALLLTIKLVCQLFQVKQLMARPSKEAYSFFNTIKLGEDNPGQEIIIKHEEVHARQWHSADVLIIEAVTIINWFNPVVYLYRFAIKHIHEFIADQQALAAGTNKADYALLLLSQTFNAPAHHLVNPFFNHSLLKQRIMMLQKDRSQRIKLAKYGLSAPLFVLMLVLSSATISNSKTITTINKRAEKVFLKPATSVVLIEEPEVYTRKMDLQLVNAAPPVPTLTIDNRKKADELQIDTVPNNTEVFTAVEQSPSFPGGDKSFGQYLAQNINYTELARKNNVQGRVIVTFIVEKNGSLTNLKLLRGIGSGLDEEALRVLSASPKWIPGKQNGRVVRVQYSVPIGFALAGKQADAIGYQAPGAGTLYTNAQQSPGFPGGKKELNRYLATHIKYPAKARENNTQGKVYISFVVETDGSLTDVRLVRGIGNGADEEALRVVKQSPKWTPGTNEGKKVRVSYTLPISFALTADPEEDKPTGAVNTDKTTYVFYKAEKNASKVLKSIDANKGGVVLRDGKNALPPIYIVDGVEVVNLEGIESKDIESISVLKNQSAVDTYGAKGVNGVVQVSLKAGKKYFKL